MTVPNVDPRMKDFGNSNYANVLRFDEIDTEFITITNGNVSTDYIAVIDIRSI